MENESSAAPDHSGKPSVIGLAALTVMRMATAAWVGAAVLFVLTSVAEQVFPEFNSTVRDQLATIRFPFYYAVGTLACTVALASGVLCRSLSPRLTAALVVVALASVVFALDYWFIYRPLQALIIPPGQPRADEFERLHRWSANVNSLHVLLMLIAAVQTAIPIRGRRT